MSRFARTCRRIAMPVIAAACVLAAAPSAQQPQPVQPDPQKEARLAWFREAKFGMFIHWGLYAIPAGEWKGARVPGIGEWIMNRAKIPVAEYETARRAVQPGEVRRRRVGAARARTPA